MIEKQKRKLQVDHKLSNVYSNATIFRVHKTTKNAPNGIMQSVSTSNPIGISELPLNLLDPNMKMPFDMTGHISPSYLNTGSTFHNSPN